MNVGDKVWVYVEDMRWQGWRYGVVYKMSSHKPGADVIVRLGEGHYVATSRDHVRPLTEERPGECP